MTQTSTKGLLMLHFYGETTLEQREKLAKDLAINESLQEELMEMIQTTQMLNAKLKSPSATSIRIVMEHSFKTEHLQEI